MCFNEKKTFQLQTVRLAMDTWLAILNQITFLNLKASFADLTERI